MFHLPRSVFHSNSLEYYHFDDLVTYRPTSRYYCLASRSLLSTIVWAANSTSWVTHNSISIKGSLSLTLRSAKNSNYYYKKQLTESEPPVEIYLSLSIVLSVLIRISLHHFVEKCRSYCVIQNIGVPSQRVCITTRPSLSSYVYVVAY